MDNSPSLTKLAYGFNTPLNNSPHPMFSLQLLQCNYLQPPAMAHYLSVHCKLYQYKDVMKHFQNNRV